MLRAQAKNYTPKYVDETNLLQQLLTAQKSNKSYTAVQGGDFFDV